MTTAPLNLPQMRERRITLEGELAAAQTALDSARAGLVVGSSKAAQVVTAQNLVSALEGALTALDAQIHDAAEQEAAERAAAYRKALTDTLLEGAEKARGHHAAFKTALEAVIADVAPRLDAAFGELYALHGLREQWVATLKEFDRAQPVRDMALPILEARADLASVRARPLPASWHHAPLARPYDFSVVQELPLELYRLWQVYSELVNQGRLPRRELKGVGHP